MTDKNPDAHRPCPSVRSEVIERLTPEFETCFSPTAISRVVADSIRDLTGVPAPDLPELAERLARQRLLTAREQFEGPPPDVCDGAHRSSV
ncbi:MAG: hypothetical protein WAW17_20480 [Rhodococcus sp. (in: high G+C Gram-positive bacteria)]|uniref:three-helix bundle dimerization domain-containing protein n=1 Tax=Rhodococcus sp. TaxID=1831 RepID=UPI003BB04EBF